MQTVITPKADVFVVVVTCVCTGTEIHCIKKLPFGLEKYLLIVMRAQCETYRNANII